MIGVHMGLQTGQVIEGKYRIIRLLGEGGMGAVYEGENLRIHRRVAIKVLHAGIAENIDAVQRFEREAQAAGRIGSDHIVEVIDLGNLPEGDRFMVMEYLDGESLSQRIHGRGRLSPWEAAPLMVQMLEGLGAAHGAGIIHRDLKPDNVYLLRSKAGRDDFVKILDFGISKFSKLNKDSGMSMTRTGAVMGTPYYMSPEQAKGSKEMDHRSDLYSAGVILYEATTGQVPFNAETFNELIFKIVLDTPAAPQQLVPGFDPSFASIIQKSIAREQNDRFQSSQEFAEALQGWLASGQGVAVPAPAPTPGPRAPAPSAPMMGAPVLGQQTPAPWANTGVPAMGQTQPHPPERHCSFSAIAGGAFVIVLGLGAFVGFKVLRPAPAAEVAPAALVPPAPAPPPPAAPTAPEIAPKPPEPPAAEPASALAAASAAPIAAKKGAPPPPAPAPKRTTEKPTPVAATAAPPAAAPSPAPPPPAAPQPTSTGRKIRTEL